MATKFAKHSKQTTSLTEAQRSPLLLQKLSLLAHIFFKGIPLQLSRYLFLPLLAHKSQQKVAKVKHLSHLSTFCT